MDKNFNKRIFVAGNQSTVIDFCDNFIDAGYGIDGLIHVGKEFEPVISDYTDMTGYCEQHNIPLYRPNSYSMDESKDKKRFTNLEIDVLISVGWQRLFPEWFLDHLTIGAFGMHGSSYRLPKGRGRSPMNWSLFEDKDRFYTYLFKYDPGVDSGRIVDMQEFDINHWDTIRSLQHKNSIAQIQLTLEHLPDILAGTVEYTQQQENVEPSYYPKRTPEDGVIDWRDTTRNIYNLIRAVTAPYPGAFTFLDDQKIMIWWATPFDESLDFSNKYPGCVLHRFHDETFVVKTGDSSLYVNDYSPRDWTPEKGNIFESHENPSWKKLDEMYRE